MTDVEDADDDLYFDAVPLNSRPASILSRLTLFHSAVDISTFEEKTAMMPEVEFSGVEIKEASFNYIPITVVFATINNTSPKKIYLILKHLSVFLSNFIFFRKETSPCMLKKFALNFPCHSKNII